MSAIQNSPNQINELLSKVRDFVSKPVVHGDPSNPEATVTPSDEAALRSILNDLIYLKYPTTHTSCRIRYKLTDPVKQEPMRFSNVPCPEVDLERHVRKVLHNAEVAGEAAKKLHNLLEGYRLVEHE